MRNRMLPLAIIAILLCGCSSSSNQYVSDQQLLCKALSFVQDSCGCTNEIQNGILTDDFIAEITECMGYGVCTTCHPNPKPYLFPINICCKDSCYRIITTASALFYYYSKENNIEQSDFRMHLQQILKKDDTLFMCNIPSGYFIGSATFYRVDTTDIEYNLFKCNKAAFLEYYFLRNKYGVYEYINDRFEIGAIVERLFHWSIIVCDGNCSDYYSDIYIRETDYPIFQKDFSEEWISVWMNSFGEKYYFEQGRIIQRKKEQMKRRWW